MTNYIKKIMLTMAFGLALVTPTLAVDAGNCEIASKQDAQEQIVEGVKHRMLTEHELKVLFDSRGRPPNSIENTPLEGELVFTDELAAVNIYQDDCFINKLGPSMKSIIFQLLGLTEARLSI